MGGGGSYAVGRAPDEERAKSGSEILKFCHY